MTFFFFVLPAYEAEIFGEQGKPLVYSLHPSSVVSLRLFLLDVVLISVGLFERPVFSIHLFERIDNLKLYLVPFFVCQSVWRMSFELHPSFETGQHKLRNG